MSVGWIFTFYLTEVKHQVYVKRQTQTRTTWPTFLSTCRLPFIISTPKLVVSRNLLFIRIAFELFYILFFYFEKFSTQTWRLPFAVYVKLKLSNDKITKGCFTNNKMNFEKQLDWQVLEKKDNCNPLHSFSSLSIRAFFSSGGSRRGARGAQVPPPPYFLNQTVCMQGQNFNNFENDRINLSVSESQHSWVARRDHTNVTGQFCLGNDFQICLRYSNFAFRGMNGPQDPVFGPEGKFFKTSQTWQS